MRIPGYRTAVQIALAFAESVLLLCKKVSDKLGMDKFYFHAPVPSVCATTSEHYSTPQLQPAQLLVAPETPAVPSCQIFGYESRHSHASPSTVEKLALKYLTHMS